MVLEGKDTINIKGLVLETPEEQIIPFDPKKEIPESDWKGIMDDINNKISKEKNLPGFSAYAFPVIVLSPERAKTIPVDQLSLEDIAIFFQEDMRTFSAQDQLTFHLSARALLPGKYTDIVLRENVQREIIRQNKNSLWWPFGDFLLKAKMIIPDVMDGVNLLPDTFDKIKIEANKSRGKGDWYSFLRYASALKLAFPERFNELKIDGHCWQGMREEFQTLNRNLSFYDAFDRAVMLTIIAADEIKFSNGGVQFISKTQPAMQDNPVPLPEMRKF